VDTSRIIELLNYGLPFILLLLIISYFFDNLTILNEKKRKEIFFTPTKNYVHKDNSVYTKRVVPLLDRITSYKEGDSKSQLFSELKKFTIYSGILLFVGAVTGMYTLWLIIIYFMALPFIRRIGYRSDMKKKFKDDFFDAIFYLILFVGGGMSLFNALIETSQLFDDKSPFKKSLNTVIKNYNLTNDNFVNLFQTFEDDYDISEVNYFINSLRISNQNGVPISDSLVNQLEYIRANRNYNFKAIAGSMGNKLTPLMIGFTMIPILIIMTVPPVLEAMSQLFSVKY
jgi:Flp pilus assembly protein TadB